MPCAVCGKTVKYKTYNGAVFAVEGKQIQFVPSALYGDELFVNKSGAVILGLKANDGMFGYRLHDCQGIYTVKKPH
jgi:hypothetical protein